MGKKDSQVVSIRANRHGGYWVVKVLVEQFDSEGTADDQVYVREVATIPQTDTPMDQAWLVAVTACHILEKQGAVGRVGGTEWPALPI